MRALLHLLLVSFALLLLPAAAHAQQSDEGSGFDESELDTPAMDPAQARALLGQALPEAPPERYALLQKQAAAAESLEQRERQIAVLEELARLGPTQGGEGWVRGYLTAEYTWGSQGKAVAAAEGFVSDRRLSPPLRASLALRQAYFAANASDRAILGRLWSRADGMAREQIKALGPQSEVAQRLQIERLQVQSEIERWNGALATSVASLREAVRDSEKLMPAAKDAAARQYAQRLLDGSLGMLSYALVRQGRSPEAVAIAQNYIALWRAGRLADNFGARWLYRLASGLVATQHFSEGLAAARESDAMLARSGASLTSHTRWLARQQMLNALLGLRQWAEADKLYQEFLAAVQDDGSARERASDWRLRALLAAKNGRVDEALETVERIHRFRTRLYGSAHPQVQEAAGVRGFVRLVRGDMSGALSDYEQLFTALLDSPGGWLDLDLRGVRGFVLGIALQQFLDSVAERGLAGQPIPAAMVDRALQLADRLRLSSAQRALADSTARLLAATPALAELLSSEQQLRRTQAERASELGPLLSEEDRRRKEIGSEEFKARPEAERDAAKAELKKLRDRIKAGQAAVASARAALGQQRERIAQAYPAYADLLTPPVPTPAQLRALLAPDEALLLVHALDSATLVWLIAPGQRETLLQVSRVKSVELMQRVARARRMLDLSQAGAPTLDEAPLLALYRDLIAPLKPDYRQIHSLIVASSGPLASLPMAALVTEPGGGHWLVKSAAVTQLPAASALLSLRRVAAARAGAKPLIGFGDPAFRAGTAGKSRSLGIASTAYDAAWGFRYADIPPLPDTRTELLAIATVLGAKPSDLILGAAATREAVLRAPLADYRVVAFATHGLMPGELPGVSKPALAMAATGQEGESPLLELDDVLGLHLKADWVLLSACNTAAADEQGGAAMSGLVRGFFFAGSRAVLATHWSVDSEASSQLVPVALKPGGGRAQALRQAQLALMEDGQGRWKHPYFWAGYALFGDPLK